MSDELDQVGVVGVSAGLRAQLGHRVVDQLLLRVDTRVDLPLLPDVLGGGSPSFALDATHTVPVGQYQEVR